MAAHQSPERNPREGQAEFAQCSDVLTRLHDVLYATRIDLGLLFLRQAVEGPDPNDDKATMDEEEKEDRVAHLRENAAGAAFLRTLWDTYGKHPTLYEFITVYNQFIVHDPSYDSYDACDSGIEQAAFLFLWTVSKTEYEALAEDTKRWLDANDEEYDHISTDDIIHFISDHVVWSKIL